MRPTRTADPEPTFAPGVVGGGAPPPRPAGRDGGRSRSRAAATRRRRSRRRLVTWGSVGLVAAVVAVLVYYLAEPAPAPRLYVTTLQKGELSQVPNACKIASAVALRQYVGGTPSKSVQTFAGTGKSECTYTFDVKPTFRVLDITVQAYSPSLIAPGNGSATSYAIYTFGQTRQALAKPPRHTPDPPAAITPISGLGSQAIGAVQIYKGSPTNDRATVLARYRNVLMTISLWAAASGGFGPVSIPQLEADAQAAARATLASVKSEPAVT
jgi:hypothetical protein